MPRFYQLHVVLHGLIGVRLSCQTRTVQLHFPSVPNHVYHAGSFDDLLSLPYGHDYRLGGVRAGGWVPDMAAMRQDHLAICLGDHKGGQLKCVARGTHATVTLPWPNDVGGVRKLVLTNAADPLFKTPAGLNPRGLRYITYLTYQVEAHQPHHPVLQWNCCKEFWRQEKLRPNMRLHFFADALSAMTVPEVLQHLPDAYGTVNDQLFQGNLAIVPDLKGGNGWFFEPCSGQESTIVPPDEAVDYCQVLNPGTPAIAEVGPPDEERRALRRMGGGGDCLPVHIQD